MTNSRNLKRKTHILALYIALFCALSIIYIYYVIPSSSYMGFGFDFDIYKFYISIIVILIFSAFTPVDGGVRSFFLNIILTIQLVPSLVIYSMAGKTTNLALVIWMAIAVVYLVSTLPMPRARLMNINSRHLLWLLLMMTGCLIVAISLYGGFGNFNLNFRQVYEFRSAAAESLPGIFSYMIPIFSKIVIPFGIVISVIFRKFIILYIFFIFSIIIFGISNHKGVVLYPIFTLSIFYALNYSNQYSRALLLFVSAIFLAFFDSFMFFISGQDSMWGWYVDLFVRRGLLIPALLDYHHIEFFSQNSQYFWSSSRLSFGMIENPYGIPSPNVIGRAYFNNVETSAGTGFIGSGFAQAGMVGVMLYSVGVGIVIAALQAFGRRLGHPFVTAVMFVQIATMLTATDFITMFLTHGLLASFVLLAIVRAPGERHTIGARKRIKDRKLPPKMVESH